MAGLGGKNWTFQEEVTSSDVNGYLADQVVMRFADSATRTAGFGGTGEPVLAEGMVSYLDDANRVDYYNGSAWKPVSQVLQVVSVTKTDTYTMSSATFTDITGLTASITPSSTNNKILIIASVMGVGQPGTTTANFRLARGGTAIAVGDAGAANQIRVTGYADAQDRPESISMTTLDSPATTSAITYSVQVRNEGSGQVSINRSYTDTNFAYYPRGSSTITLMEIAG